MLDIVEEVSNSGGLSQLNTSSHNNSRMNTEKELPKILKLEQFIKPVDPSKYVMKKKVERSCRYQLIKMAIKPGGSISG